MSIFLGTLENSNNLVLSNIFAWLSLFCATMYLLCVGCCVLEKAFSSYLILRCTLKKNHKLLWKNSAGSIISNDSWIFCQRHWRDLLRKQIKKSIKGVKILWWKSIETFKSSPMLPWLLPSILFCLHFYDLLLILYF